MQIYMYMYVQCNDELKSNNYTVYNVLTLWNFRSLCQIPLQFIANSNKIEQVLKATIII